MSKADEIRNLLETKWSIRRIWTSPSHGPQALGRCPKCHGENKPENREGFSVNLETGAFACNRKNNCGVAGGWKALQELFGVVQDHGKVKLWEPPKTIIYTRPDPAKNKPIEKIDPMVEWFKGRGISKETLDMYGIWLSESKSGPVIIFPVRNPAGELVNQKYRLLERKEFRNDAGTLRLPFGMNLVPDDTDSLLIVEGEIDLLAAVEYGISSVISLPNGVQDMGWIEACFDWLERFTRIWICTDMDGPGREACDLLVERLGKWRCYTVELPFKDMDECLMQSVGQAEIMGCLSSAKEYTPKKLRNVEDFKEAVKETQKPSKLMGVSTGSRELDLLIKGWRSGELTIWTGPNGEGKSTIVNQLFLNLMAQGERCLIFSGELAPPRLLRWALCQYWNAETLTDEQIDQGIDDLAPCLWLVDHVGRIDQQTLFDTAIFAARKHGVRHVLVDSLMRVKVGRDDYEAQDGFVDALGDLADQFGIHVHLVAHPRKQKEEDKKLSKFDVKGSGTMIDLCDNLFMVQRGREYTTIRCAKNREHGTLGTVQVQVNPKSKRVTFGGIQTSQKPREGALKEKQDGCIGTGQENTLTPATETHRPQAELPF